MITGRNRPSALGDEESAPVDDSPPMDEDEAEYKAMMKEMTPADLRRIFRQYDEDGSGEISNDELQALLTKLMGKLPSDEAVNAILADIDADGSGMIDEDEFLEFFSRIENLNQFREKLIQKGKKSAFFGRFSVMFFSLNFIAFFGLALLNLNSEPGTMQAQQARFGVIVSGSLLGFAVLLGVIVPMVKHRYSFVVETFVSKAQQKRNQRMTNARVSKVVDLEFKKERKSNKKLTKLQQLQNKADEAFVNLPEPPNLPPSAPPKVKRHQVDKIPSADQSYRPSRRMSTFEESNDAMIAPKPPAVPWPKDERPNSAMAHSDDSLSSPKPPNVPPPTLPMDQKNAAALATSSSMRSYRPGKRVSESTSNDRAQTRGSAPKRPSSAPGGRMGSSDGSDLSARLSVGKVRDAHDPKGLSFIRIGNVMEVGYSLQNYQCSRDMMAHMGSHGFNPLSNSKRARYPFMSAEATLQIAECQPNFFDHNVWATPPASALPSPRLQQLSLPLDVGRLGSEALALRDAQHFSAEDRIERRVASHDSVPRARPRSAPLSKMPTGTILV
eukprot:gnl/MRDRNA2_/MRDRNA2_34512_c0_seq1.p1 gnl/MRDRNA2_/MRDRNA2_34512_c0~~gnl/MRDRNA2_/MRDRNA2_34512_c0_seq1.p1  ORF type:complete len:556 (+),score=112.15 gnl/MRDRNA2_/MRDRNA2_34512_c0_seq1:148-1815(+)